MSSSPFQPDWGRLDPNTPRRHPQANERSPVAGGPRIVVLASECDSARYFIRQLEQRFDLAAVVWERRNRWRSLRSIFRRSHKLGWCYPIDRLALAVYVRWKLRSAAREASAWREEQSAHEYSPRCAQCTVPSVNDPAVLKVLAEQRAELVLVWGTAIIGREVLGAGPSFINVHYGITPLYRGAHGGFWAAALGDDQNIGVTVHRVDQGIDTGQILRQVRIDFDPAADNLLTLTAKQTVTGAQAVIDWLDQHLHDFATAPTVAGPPGKSKLYYSPGLRDYLRFQRQVRDRLQQRPS